MNRQQIKFNWKSAFSAIALTVGALGISSTTVRATPEIGLDSAGFKLAQVGVRSRINAPVPLNLRPRVHIPSPSRRSDYYPRREYSRHDRYGYDRHHGRHRHHSHHRQHRGGTVIIINPATSSSYSHYSNQDGYIRIINK